MARALTARWRRSVEPVTECVHQAAFSSDGDGIWNSGGTEKSETNTWFIFVSGSWETSSREKNGDAQREEEEGGQTASVAGLADQLEAVRSASLARAATTSAPWSFYMIFGICK
jgi:hypothetical protein